MGRLVGSLGSALILAVTPCHTAPPSDLQAPAARARYSGPASCDTPGSAQSEPKQGVGEANLVVVEESLSVRSEGSVLRVLGEVRNEGSLPAMMVSVDLVAFDSSGDLIAFGGAGTPYWELAFGSTCRGTAGVERPCILPGEVAWFRSLLLADPEAIDRVQALARGFEQEVEPVESPLQLEGEVELTGSQWGSTLTGEVRNHGDAAVVIPDGVVVHWDDVVSSLFGIQGSAAGYLHLQSDVPLAVAARTWNETASGSLGQLLPTLTPGTCLDEGVLAPVRGGAFRTNIGLVNLCDREKSVSVRLFNDAGTLVADFGQIELAGESWRQLNDVAPPSFEVGRAVVEAETCCLWCYASVIDRGTGDPTTFAVEPRVTIHLPTPALPRGDGGW